jgi:spore cortex formation protein SpoVR/YcgB (stage V sporulation)
MPLKITHRKEDEVPTPSAMGRVNEDLETIKSEMRKLAPGMVLEIDVGTQKAVRGTKMLVTRASAQLGSRWQHWHFGTVVFAKPAGEIRRRGKRAAKAG